MVGPNKIMKNGGTFKQIQKNSMQSEFGKKTYPMYNKVLNVTHTLKLSLT